jgi:tetrachlorobenzoquinone reductase
VSVLKLRVASFIRETDTITAIELRSPDGELLPPFEAGSHIDLHLPSGLMRSYSLVNPQSERHRYLLGVARAKDGRGGSSYVHERLRVGDVLDVESPRNLFRLHESEAPAVLIGGGIGITPLISMAARLTRLGRDWTLNYAVRTRSEAAFLPILETYGTRVTLHCDDERGGVLNLKVIIRSAAAGAHFYCCGPAPMMRAFDDLTKTIQPERIHVEHFSPPNEVAVENQYVVELAKAGKTFVVPRGQTILETLTNAGFDLPHSCQQGICGACETRVIAGIPDHRDAVLSPAERAANQTMMICCSGSRSEKLILDI